MHAVQRDKEPMAMWVFGNLHFIIQYFSCACYIMWVKLYCIYKMKRELNGPVTKREESLTELPPSGGMKS